MDIWSDFNMVYAQESDCCFHTNQEVRMTKKRNSELDRRMQKIRGGRVVINHTNNTFRIVQEDDLEKDGDYK